MIMHSSFFDGGVVRYHYLVAVMLRLLGRHCVYTKTVLKVKSLATSGLLNDTDVIETIIRNSWPFVSYVDV